MSNPQNNIKALILDIETSGLFVDMVDYSSFPYKLKPDANLWCVVIRNAYTDEVVRLVKEEITKERLEKELEGCTHLIGHNLLKFDLLASKLFGVLDYSVGYIGKTSTLFGKPVKIIDTLVLSRLFNPDRYNGHSLESWGQRTGTHKIDFRQICIDKGYIQKSDPKGAEFKQFCEEMVTYCITPENKVLNKDLNWVEARTLKVGDNILGFDEYSEKTRSGRRYKTAKVEWIDYETTDVYEVELSSGKKIKTTKEHRWLVANSNHGGNSLKWVETQHLHTKETSKHCSKIPKLFNTWEEDISKEAGWLAGMFDGEATLSNNWFKISIAQRPTSTLDKLEKLLKEKHSGGISERLVNKKSDCKNLLLQGCAAERLEFLGKIKPQRLLEKFNFEMLGRVESRLGKDEVISVKYIGKEEIIKIQTSSKTFICEGYPMHNCEGDTETNKIAFFALVNEMGDYKGWSQAIEQENKLADLAIKRENLGFWFNKEEAVKAVEELTVIMQELTDKVNPILPPKKMNKGEMAFYIPPKVQLKADGKPSSNMIKFAIKVGGEVGSVDEKYVLKYKGEIIPLPFEEPLETHIVADISNLDHVKMTLIDDYGWIPQEWAERDLTKDSKKQSIPIEKRIKALEKWYAETLDGKYRKLRLEIACERFKAEDEEELFDIIKSKLNSEFPVRIPTSPKVRVGVEKELCPNLITIGEKVDFANDFALFLTYKHRKACIAGGDIEDMDFDVETPNTGYLANYREVDGRIPTPAIEIGAASNRYRHIGVANVPRASSVYGKEMRSLFGCGEGFLQLGYDFSSLENRVQGGYVRKYEDGEALAAMLLAEKPNDLHSINAVKLGISRSDAKSFGYAILYGASPNKLAKMLNVSLDKAKELYEAFWSAVPALKQLKDAVQKFWESTDKKYVRGIDGRKIFIRSPHSLLNFLFQSGGVICAKYVTVYMAEELENKGYCIDPFEGIPDAANMIEYHDEAQMMINPSLISFERFKTKEEGLEFIENWNGEHQLSTLKEGNTWYVALPNEVSIAIKKGIKKTEDLLKLDFELGFEFDIHRNWHGCH